ncbi:cytochrome P450 [Colletotrichum asianum]
MIDKKALTAREFVRKRFQAVGPGSQTEPGDTTNFHRHIRKLCESHGTGPKTWNGHQLLLISGLEPNLTAAVTWMLIHLLDGDGHLSTSVRNEADSFVEKSDGEIDLCRVSDECPLLQATWYEVLRFYGTFTLGRHVRDKGDAVIASGYTLERGTFVLTPWRLHHFDRVVWDEDSEVFGPRRFLYARGRVDDGRHCLRTVRYHLSWNRTSGELLDVLMNDLLPHVDATFRTNGKRGVEGFSMGGYGALHLAFKFPEQFEGVSAIGPAVLRSLAEEPRERVWDTFQGDQRYYDLNHPINLLEEKSQAIHFAPLHIRLLVGSDDTRLVEAVKSLADSLQRCGILHRNIGVPNIGHDYVAVMEATQPGIYTFWDECLKP